MAKTKRVWNCAEIVVSGSEKDPNSIQVQVGRNSDNIYLRHTQDVTQKTFQGDITVVRDARGVIIGVTCDIIAPMPDMDPNEPIPYEVTDKGREWLEGHPENEREEARIRQVFGLK